MIPMHPKPLRHFIETGIGLIPTYPGGKTHGSWKDKKNFLYSIEQVGRFWSKDIRWFQLYPYQSDLVVLDIDVKNGKNGINDLYRLFEDTPAPTYLESVDMHPCHVKTPSGGYHLYFLYAGRKQFQSGLMRQDMPGLEVIHYNHVLTAPGSERENGRYTLYGSLEQAPRLPLILEKRLSEYGEKKQSTNSRRPQYAYDNHDMPLEKIHETVTRQGEHEHSRNAKCYAIATFAKKKNYGPVDVENYISNHFVESDFPDNEIKQIVKSAFR